MVQSMGPVSCCTYPFNESIRSACRVFLEHFTQGLSNDVNRSFFSPGTHLVIHKNLEIGLRVGWGITPAAANFFSDAGLAIRY